MNFQVRLLERLIQNNFDVAMGWIGLCAWPWLGTDYPEVPQVGRTNDAGW